MENMEDLEVMEDVESGEIVEKKTAHIELGKFEGFTARNQAKVHLLPFKIHADCDAKVDSYFNSTIEKTEDGHLSASLRGYPLRGATIDIPTGYKGLVLHESQCIDKDDRSLYIVNHFDKMTYWNWSKVPSKNDAIQQALDWIDIAEALHSPINEE